MPTVEEYTMKKTTTIILAGASGNGKSVLASFAPTPHAILCIDKDTPAHVDGVDSSLRHYKPYPPAECELDKNEYLPARNIADHLYRDVKALKNHFISIQRGKPEPLNIVMMDGKTETWRTPATIIVEGAETIALQTLNQILAINGKSSVDQFVLPGQSTANAQAAYNMRLMRLEDAYGMLTRLPCNIIVTTWIAEDMGKDDRGRSINLGIFRPSFGGKLNKSAPGKFESSLMLFTDNGRYFARTRDNSMFKGFKVGNQFGLREVIDLTIETKAGKVINPCKELWDKLLAPPIETVKPAEAEAPVATVPGSATVQ
jgi:hypothetical protein